jgi:hypothetical protein
VAEGVWVVEWVVWAAWAAWICRVCPSRNKTQRNKKPRSGGVFYCIKRSGENYRYFYSSPYPMF